MFGLGSPPTSPDSVVHRDRDTLPGARIADQGSGSGGLGVLTGSGPAAIGADATLDGEGDNETASRGGGDSREGPGSVGVGLVGVVGGVKEEIAAVSAPASSSSVSSSRGDRFRMETGVVDKHEGGGGEGRHGERVCDGRPGSSS